MTGSSTTTLSAAGALRESKPRHEAFADVALFERRSRIPLLLFIAAHKPR